MALKKRVAETVALLDAKMQRVRRDYVRGYASGTYKVLRSDMHPADLDGVSEAEFIELVTTEYLTKV